MTDKKLTFDPPLTDAERERVRSGIRAMERLMARTHGGVRCDGCLRESEAEMLTDWENMGSATHPSWRCPKCKGAQHG